MSVVLGVVLLVAGVAMCAGYIRGLVWLCAGDSWLDGSIARALGSIFGVVLLWFVGAAVGVSGVLLILGS